MHNRGNTINPCVTRGRSTGDPCARTGNLLMIHALPVAYERTIFDDPKGSSMNVWVPHMEPTDDPYVPPVTPEQSMRY